MRYRQLEPELMDDRSLDPEMLGPALQGLRTINLLSASAASLWEPIARLASRTGKKRLRVLDIATGSGDIPISLWKKARSAGLQLDLRAVDFNERSIALAKREAERVGANIRFDQVDVLKEPLPSEQDVVISSLFLHHLTEAAAINLLRNMSHATEHLLLVNDLRRFGLLLAHFAGRVLTTSPIVRVDAVLSVKAAFTIAEMQSLARAAGLENAQFVRRWPCRFLLIWEKPTSVDSSEQSDLGKHSRPKA